MLVKQNSFGETLLAVDISVGFQEIDCVDGKGWLVGKLTEKSRTFLLFIERIHIAIVNRLIL
jgi:hypothetical protein